MIIGKRNILLIIAVILLFVNFLTLAIATPFTKYEIDKLSEIICNDCKYSTFLVVCENFDPIGGILENKADCIDHHLLDGSSRRTVYKDLFKRGELYKYNNGIRVELNETVDDWKKTLYIIEINNITKEELTNYLELNNQGAIGSVYIGKPNIACNTDREGKQHKYFYSDMYGQKYWGGELIKEPRSLLNMTLEFSILGGFFGFGITILSITFFSHLIKRKKFILFNKYVFTYEKKR